MAEPFSYAILRLVPDIERGEQLNVGVVVFCRPLDFLGARTALDDFAAGSTVKVRTYRKDRLSPEDTIRNAESRLGSDGYHLVRNNCEHFTAWCCTGRAVSSQVRHWLVAAQGTVASLFAAQSLGPHVVIAGTIGAGVYAASRPLRRR